MKIEIEIPKEFEEHFKQDKFEDTLHRLSADAHLIAGNYEQETAIMLIKAFADSKPAYDVERVVAELEDKFEQTVAEILDKTGSDFTIADFNVKRYSDRICEIVRKGGAE